MIRKIASYLYKTLLLLSLAAAALEVSDKGYRFPTNLLSADYTLMKLTPTEESLAKDIKKINYKLSSEETTLYAKQILKVSQCFKIDPWVLTGLIQKESAFKKEAISPTGAAGLTQFTTLGFKEVHDQLGFRGREGASEAATQYLQSTLKGCIDESWVDLWNRIELKEEDPEYYNRLKKELMENSELAIVYGAILLKTYIAHTANRAERNESELQDSEIYFQALQIYNGEEGDAKVRYAKNIFINLKNIYPQEVNFPFLTE